MTVKQGIMVLIIAVSALAVSTVDTCIRVSKHIAEHKRTTESSKSKWKTIPAVRPVSDETEKKYNDSLKDSLQDLNAINDTLDRMLERAQQERDNTRALLDLLLIERARVNKVPK